MPPRAPVIWTTHAVGSERFRRRIDERHRELTVAAKARARSYRRDRSEPGSEVAARLRADFLVALGRLASFESATVRLARSRYEFELRSHADDIARDYFELWRLVARRGIGVSELEERSSERLDQFATQLGRLEGMADALLLAGRNVRLFPVPEHRWTPAQT